MEEKKTGYNQKKNIYTQNYIRDNYKQISIRVQKTGDLTRESMQSAADQAGESLNGYILEAVRRRMESGE